MTRTPSRTTLPLWLVALIFVVSPILGVGLAAIVAAVTR